MVSLNEYRSLSDFDGKRRKALESLLYSDEEFIYGIDVYDAILLAKARASKLVLTDQRVLEFKRGFIKETSKDFSLDEIASIEHKKGYVMRKIALEGHGVSKEYQTLEDYGRTFVTSVREQKSRNEEGREPIDAPTASNSSGSSSAMDEEANAPGAAEVPSKFGSIKAHVVIAFLTIWWTVGLGNVGYAAYKYYKFNNP